MRTLLSFARTARTVNKINPARNIELRKASRFIEGILLVLIGYGGLVVIG
jgi:hypothetical protein